jgi:hypothetical protein
VSTIWAAIAVIAAAALAAIGLAALLLARHIYRGAIGVADPPDLDPDSTVVLPAEVLEPLLS